MFKFAGFLLWVFMSLRMCSVIILAFAKFSSNPYHISIRCALCVSKLHISFVARQAANEFHALVLKFLVMHGVQNL